MTNRSKVLMIGWLSSSINYRHTDQMCLDLIGKLKSMVDITVIIPVMDSKATLNGVKVIELPSESLDYMSSPVEQNEYNHEGFLDDSNYTSVNARVFSSETQEFSHPEHKETLFAATMKFSDCVVSEICTRDFDIIHVQDWLSCPAGVAAKKLLDIPLVVHSHTLESEKDGNIASSYVNSIEKESLIFADLVLTPSRYSKNILINKYLVDEHKIKVVPNGINTFLPPVGKEKKPYLIVLVLGRFLNQNSPECIIDIAKRVIDYVPDVRFVVAGPSDYLSNIIEKATHHRIGDRFFFTGVLGNDQAEQLLKLTDVYLMPAVSEPFGVSVLEAMQHDIPCVVSYQAGVSEFLPHALKSDFWNTNQMANHVISLLRYNALREDIINSTRSNIQNFDWHNSAVEIKRSYEEIIC